MIAIRTTVLVFASLVGGAASVLAQGAPSSKPAPPAAPTRPRIDLSRPEGSTIKCKDGTWAPKGADASACDAHRGLAYRLPEIIKPPAAKPRPDADQPRPTPPSAPEVVGGAKATGDATPSNMSGAAGRETAPPPNAAPPANAVMLCRDGTYLSGERIASRCDAHGGLTGYLPSRRP
jgi:hypothetical protein